MAEAVAALFLQLKGYRVLARRVRTKAGEIDLVVRRGNVLVFVEVKARHTLDSGVFALHPAALQRIGSAARVLAPRFLGRCTTTRIDAVVVRPLLDRSSIAICRSALRFRRRPIWATCKAWKPASRRQWR